jgi:hypothetical protein
MDHLSIFQEHLPTEKMRASKKGMDQKKEEAIR